MADKHSLNFDVRELKLGASFTNNKSSQYHTIKYDFKPASVDVNKMATVDVGVNNQVIVTVPHLDGAGVPQTVFKGSQRPYTKECVLIIDRVTGEITLEKLSSNIQVKKTRQESAQKPRPLTPVTSELTNTTQRSTSRTRVATNRRTPNTAGAGPSAGGPANAAGASQARFNGAPKPGANLLRSPPRHKTSPPQAAPWSGGGNSTLASLPMIGLEEPPAPRRPAPPAGPARDLPRDLPRDPSRDLPRDSARDPSREPPREPAPRAAPEPQRDTRDLPRTPPQQQPAQDDSSSSSSSDSGSDSGSDSDSDDDATPATHATHATQPLPSLAQLPATLPTTNGHIAPMNTSLPRDVLNDDLCLSESGSSDSE